MKKISLILTAVVSLILFSTTLIFAQSDKAKNPNVASNSNKNRNIEVLDIEEVEETDETPVPSETTEPTRTKQGNSPQVQLENAIRKMEQLQERINNPEVGQQVEETTQNQEEVKTQIQKKLDEMDARPGFLKFILGPDYKNAGEVRSAIVRLQNEIRQMDRIQTRLNNPEDVGVMEEAINEVGESIRSYQDLLSDKLSGFSLFGWLSKFIAGYTPTPTETPSPLSTQTPAGSPIATP